MDAIDQLKELLNEKRDEVRKLEEAIRILGGTHRIVTNRRSIRGKNGYEGKSAPDALLEVLLNNVDESGAHRRQVDTWARKMLKMPKGTVSSSIWKLKKLKLVTVSEDGVLKLAKNK